MSQHGIHSNWQRPATPFAYSILSKQTSDELLSFHVYFLIREKATEAMSLGSYISHYNIIYVSSIPASLVTWRSKSWGQIIFTNYFIQEAFINARYNSRHLRYRENKTKSLYCQKQVSRHTGLWINPGCPVAPTMTSLSEILPLRGRLSQVPLLS